MNPGLVFLGFVFVVLEAALRAALGAFAVWCGLRLLRVRNVPVQKAAWGMVLVAALAMPLAMRWHWTVSLPLPKLLSSIPEARAVTPPMPQATPELRADAPEIPQIPAEPQSATSLHRARHARLRATNGAAPVQPTQFDQPGQTELSTISAPETLPAPAPELPVVSSSAPARPSIFTLRFFAMAGEALYFCVCAVLLFRLMWGLCAAIWLWLKAEPIRDVDGLGATSTKGLRSSRQVGAPSNIGSGVLLPADYAQWDAQKLRIVLAHERAHIRQGDFYLQALAGLYAAVFWFSPLGWWLKRKLTDLGEAISDRAGLDEAASSSMYAQLLLEFAAQPHPTPIGVAMARRSNLSHRIEQLLNETNFRHAFAGSKRRALMAALLVTAALFASTAMIRVRAAATSQALEPPVAQVAQAPTTGQSNPDAAQAPAPQSTPSPAPEAAPAAQPAPQAAPAPEQATPAGQAEVPAIHVDVPAKHIDIPAIHVDVPAKHIVVPAVHVDVAAKHIDIPAKHIDVPAVHVDVPEQHIDIPAIHFDQPAQHIDVPAIHIDEPARTIDVPAIHIDEPAEHLDVPAPPTPAPPPGASNNPGNRYPYASGGALYAMNGGFGFAGFRRAMGLGRGMVEQAAPQDQTFDRTLTVSGKADLSVATGAGNIHLTHGAAGQIKIHGIVHAGALADQDQVRQIIANPPIEQDGNTIRVGGHNHNNIGTNHISISYEIEAPADTALSAATGSGNIVDEGVGADAKLTTGSGNINATGLSGDYKITTGSGNISLEQSGSGDGKAQAGSGNVEIKNAQGGLNAMTGSGTIKATGTPSQPWKLMTGSGTIELWTGNAPMNLNASVGSGTIHTDHEMVSEGTADKHHVMGKINGGGTEVRVEAGSGNITVR